MKLCLTTINTNSEYIIIYGYTDSKWIKIKSIRVKDKLSLELDNLDYEKIRIRIIPKYISKFGWLLLFSILGVLDLLTTCFGSFSLSDKYYVDYELNREEELNLEYNGESVYHNDTNVTGKAKGKFIPVLIVLLSFAIYGSIIAICISFGINPSVI